MNAPKDLSPDNAPVKIALPDIADSLFAQMPESYRQREILIKSGALKPLETKIAALLK